MSQRVRDLPVSPYILDSPPPPGKQSHRGFNARGCQCPNVQFAIGIFNLKPNDDSPLIRIGGRIDANNLAAKWKMSRQSIAGCLNRLPNFEERQVGWECF